MAFGPPQTREDQHGRWTVFHYGEMPIAQLFLPAGWQPDREFAFFWLGSAQPSDLHWLIHYLVDPHKTDVSGRMIGPIGASDFAFAAPHRDGGASWQVGNLLHVVDTALLPCNLGVTIANELEPSLPSIYFWATVEPTRELLDATDSYPEIGVKLTFHDWQNTSTDLLIRSLILRRSRMTANDGDIDWLWQAIASAVQGTRIGLR